MMFHVIDRIICAACGALGYLLELIGATGLLILAAAGFKNWIKELCEP